MKSNRTLFARRYQAGLRGYLHRKSSLKSARLLGAQAVSARLEMLEVARIHEKSILAEAQLDNPGKSRDQLIRKACAYFAEVVVPIEKTHPSARDAALRLNELVQCLTERTAELASSKRDLLQEIARRAEIELALKKNERHYRQLLEESVRLQEQLRYLSHQILSTQEEERKRISRELHDHIAGTLTGINMELANLKLEAAGNDESLERKIANTQRLVLHSVDVIHEFARDLRPTTLDDLGLIPALHSFTKALSKQTGLQVRMKVYAAVEELDNQKRTVLYRVTQEALTNVAKHAKASQVDVSIKKTGDEVALAVHDDGKSFPVEQILHNPKNRRLGLLGMRERVEMVGGRFSVHSARGQGTTVSASIPIAQHGKTTPAPKR